MPRRPAAAIRFAPSLGEPRTAPAAPDRRALDPRLTVPLDRALLLDAGALAETSLRALDAIHVAAAVSLTPPIDGFLGCDERQAPAARLAGLRTFAPHG